VLELKILTAEAFQLFCFCASGFISGNARVGNEFPFASRLAHFINLADESRKSLRSAAKRGEHHEMV